MARPKAFIVDDDPTFVKILEYELNKAGFTPFESYESGEECLANLDSKPRIVLLDFSLGGLNGLDVLRSIKKKSPRTDVIMLTAVEDDMVRQKCFEAGATNYIIKDPDGIERLNKEVFPKYKGGFFSFFR
jgi:two-component system OmpR family response regulator